MHMADGTLANVPRVVMAYCFAGMRDARLPAYAERSVAAGKEPNISAPGYASRHISAISTCTVRPFEVAQEIRQFSINRNKQTPVARVTNKRATAITADHPNSRPTERRWRRYR
jgi:hypothetical protein